MRKRKLGNTALEVYPIAFGGNVFGWTIDKERSFEILDGFTNAGFNFIDTADVYSRWASGNYGGESERIIGNWMEKRRNRSQLIIATKVGSEMALGKKGLSKKHIIQSAEDSLMRLKTDYIDLYQTHYDDLETPVQETLEAYQQLIEEGKVRFIGTSNMSVHRIKESLAISKQHDLPMYHTLQPEYNLYARENYEKNYEPIVAENNMGVLSYYSLASGFLTGKYRTADDLGKSKRGPGIKNYLNDRGLKILDALDQVSEQYSANQASIALAWLISRPTVTAPIVSVTSIEQLSDLIKSAELELDVEDITVLDEASDWE